MTAAAQRSRRGADGDASTYDEYTTASRRPSCRGDHEHEAVAAGDVTGLEDIPACARAPRPAAGGCRWRSAAVVGHQRVADAVEVDARAEGFAPPGVGSCDRSMEHDGIRSRVRHLVYRFEDRLPAWTVAERLVEVADVAGICRLQPARQLDRLRRGHATMAQSSQVDPRLSLAAPTLVSRFYDGSVISWDGDSQVLDVHGVPLAVDKVSPLADGGFEATLTVRPGRLLRLTADSYVDDSVAVDLWAGTPDDSEGLAVLADAGEPTAVAAIPLCGCGDRGCGNSGLQLDTEVTADEFLPLVRLLVRLPTSDRVPRKRKAVWRSIE